MGDTQCFLISLGRETKRKALECLKRDGASILEINNIEPMNIAFNKMIETASSKYFIQVDDDMFLVPGAVAQMEEFISKTNDNVAFVCFLLWDTYRQHKIQGVKIYKTEILKHYKFDNEDSTEMGLIEKLNKDGFTYLVEDKIMGDHSPIYDEKSCYEFWRNYFYKDVRHWNKISGYLKEAFKKYIKDPKDKMNLFALLGMIAGCNIDEERNNREKMKSDYSFKTFDILKYYFDNKEEWVLFPDKLKFKKDKLESSPAIVQEQMKQPKVAFFNYLVAVGGAEVHSVQVMENSSFKFDFIYVNELGGIYGGDYLLNRIEKSKNFNESINLNKNKLTEKFCEYDVVIICYLGGIYNKLLKELSEIPKEQRPKVILINHIDLEIISSGEVSYYDKFGHHFSEEKPMVCDNMFVFPELKEIWRNEISEKVYLDEFKIGALYSPDENEVEKLKRIHKKDGKKIIMMIGRCDERKGAYDLVYLSKKMKENGLENYKFFCLGRYTNDHINKLKQKMNEEGVNNIYWLGQIPKDQMSNYLSIADYFIHVSQDETYPVAILEYAFANKPIFVKYKENGKRREKYVFNVEHVNKTSYPFKDEKDFIKVFKNIVNKNIVKNKGYKYVLKNNSELECLKDLDDKLIKIVNKSPIIKREIIVREPEVIITEEKDFKHILLIVDRDLDYRLLNEKIDHLNCMTNVKFFIKIFDIYKKQEVKNYLKSFGHKNIKIIDKIDYENIDLIYFNSDKINLFEEILTKNIPMFLSKTENKLVEFFGGHCECVNFIKNKKELIAKTKVALLNANYRDKLLNVQNEIMRVKGIKL